MLCAAELVACVIDGSNLTDSFERMLDAQPGWHHQLTRFGLF